MTAWRTTARLALRELLRSRLLVALAVVIVLVVATLNAVLIGHFAVVPAARAGSRPGVAATVGIAAYVAAVVSPGIVGSVLFSMPLVRAQATGRIAALLCTTVSAPRLWTAHAAALWVVQLFTGLVVPAGVTAALWLAAGSTGSLAIDGSLALTAFAIVPVLYAALALLMTLVGLTGSAGGANTIGIVVYAGLSSTMPRMLGTVSPSEFALLHLGLVAVVIGVVCALTSRVTPQRLVAVTG